MEPAKIFHIVTRLMVGGPSIQTILLTEGLTKNGFQCTLIYGTEDPHEGNMRHLAQSKGMQPIVLPELGKQINPKADLIALVKLYRLIKREMPHVVHTHLTKAGVLGRLAAKMAGVPVIVHTYHGYSLAYYGWVKTRIFLEIDRLMNSLSDKVIAISSSMCEELVESYGIVKRDQATVIPVGLELDSLSECHTLKGQFRRELGVSPTTALVGIISRLVPVKNHKLFLSAAKEVTKQFSDIMFLIIGDGELRHELEEYTEKLKLGKWARFLGWRRDLTRIYADLDCAVLTSNSEGTPVSLMEALSARCPVVATDVGDVKEVVEDQETGYLVESNNIEALSNAIISVLHNPDKAQRMSEQGRQIVTSKFASSRLVSDVRKLYMELLQEKRFV